MHRNSGRRDLSPVRDRTTRRYGPHRISYETLTELKYWREFYIDQFDICDRPVFRPYKKYLLDESLWGDVNTDDEEDADEEDLKNEIHVTDINLNNVKNALDHHTSDYKCIRKRTVEEKEKPASLVVRRGQVYTIDMTFDREYDPKKHDLKLRFKTGLDPAPLRGTDITIILDEQSNKFDNSGTSKWQARVANKMPNTKLEIEVLPPADCVIGKWELHVYTISKDKRGVSNTLHLKHGEKIIILFNPWCKMDDVYLPVDPEFDSEVDPREEYVLNPVGVVYKTNQRGSPWRFGQFDEDILDVSLKLVSRYFKGIPDQKMGSPVNVSRAISSMVNANDNEGVLVGRWGKPYTGGTKPWKWVGSTKILQQYNKSGSVKYGQCWVFSGVTVTVCRALGIPCKSVTNYDSAHDADQTHEIEYLMIYDGLTSESLNSDSVWNFHVWNEVWFTRPDLKGQNVDGWQVIDATPQEKSDGMMQCGPCPVQAVKKGFTYMPNDTGFVFSEVNADKVFYQKTASGGLRRVKTRKNSVGTTICTKKPDGKPMSADDFYGRSSQLIVTNHYKFPEGSADERTAVARARRYAGDYIIEEEEEVNIDIRTKKDEFEIGEDVAVVVTVKNTRQDEGPLKIKSVGVQLSFTDYRGVFSVSITKKQFDGFYIEQGEEKTFDLTATWDQYKDNIDEYDDVRASAVVNVAWSGNSFPEDIIFTLRNPVKLVVDIPKTCKVGEAVEVTFKVFNPVKVDLTTCALKIDDEKFEDHQDIELNEIIKSNIPWTKTVEMMPIRPGTGQIIAVLDTNELPNITGHGETEINA